MEHLVNNTSEKKMIDCQLLTLIGFYLTFTVRD